MPHQTECRFSIVISAQFSCHRPDHRIQIRFTGKKRCSQRQPFKTPLIRFHFRFYIHVFKSIHQMGRLHNQIFNPIGCCPVKCLLQIVDRLLIPLFQFINDPLAGKCPAPLICRKCLRHCTLNRSDRLFSAVIVACPEADYQDCLSWFHLSILPLCFLSFNSEFSRSSYAAICLNLADI